MGIQVNTLSVNDVPFSLTSDSGGYYAYAVGQHVDVNGSPLIVTFDPPIAPTVDLGEVYRQI